MAQCCIKDVGVLMNSPSNVRCNPHTIPIIPIADYPQTEFSKAIALDSDSESRQRLLGHRENRTPGVGVAIGIGIERTGTWKQNTPVAVNVLP